jgi:metal-responsive CopG/Arc/MetJ family transcriptional regulator
MTSVAKVAVSIPLPTAKRLERVRAKKRLSRSAAVTRAVELWLRSEEVAESDQRYVEGYLRHPERTDASTAVAEAAVANWEPWE